MNLQGWGCAYRTLQSLCSWIAKNRDDTIDVDDNALIGTDVPSVEEIQQTLVNINDKPPEFLNSTDWLGALEVSAHLAHNHHHLTNNYNRFQFRRYSM